jgi:hypothetical protein
MFTNFIIFWGQQAVIFSGYVIVKSRGFATKKHDST